MTTLSLILLHGLGASGNDMQPIAQALSHRLRTANPTLHTRIHCPDAPARPVTVNGGYVMPAWFDLYSLEAHARMDSDGIEIAADLDGTKEQKKDAAKGAMVNVYLKDGTKKGLMFMGDSGAGKSETLEALSTLASDLIDHQETEE